MIRAYVSSLMTDQRDGAADRCVKAVLYFFSLGYGLVMRMRGWCYDHGWKSSVRLPRPVISVGNLTVGGVGKTPLVIRLCEIIRELGFRPAVLTRGYKGRVSQDGALVSDEAEMLKASLKGLPVGVGPDRVKSAGDLLSKEQIDVFVLDDGFQHRRVKRDLDVVVLDAGNPFGNGHLLPRGVLRENIDAVRRADVCVLTKTDTVARASVEEITSKLQTIKPVAMVEAVHQPTAFRNLKTEAHRGLSAFSGKRVGAFCSIGDPASFRRSLEAAECLVEDFWTFPDHHWYSTEELQDLKMSALAGKLDALVTTDKDAVKLPAHRDLFSGVEVYSLSVKLEFVEGYEELVDRVRRLLRR